jgi:hypothetical protein
MPGSDRPRSPGAITGLKPRRGDTIGERNAGDDSGHTIFPHSETSATLRFIGLFGWTKHEEQTVQLGCAKPRMFG